jgi:hypothetical protein
MAATMQRAFPACRREHLEGRRRGPNGSPSTSRRSLAVAARLLALSLAAPASASTITGTLEGHVIDDRGAPIAGVLVRLVNVENGFAFAARTDASGLYHIDLLPIATYEIRAEKDGFQPGGIKRFQAEVNTTKTITPPPIQLFPLGASATGSTAGAPLQVNATDATLRTNAPEDFIVALPLGGVRSFDTFALLAPGVAPPPQTVGSNGPGIGPGVGTAGQFSVNGQRARANNFTIDGSDNNDQDVGVRRQGFTPTIPQPVESIREFEISTLLSDAEAGRNTGGQINVVSRPGTNAVHGQAYLFFTDDALNARDFFDYSGVLVGSIEENPEKNPFRRYQAGGAIGAPINQDRLHVVAAFERQDVSRVAELHFATPTSGERNAALNRCRGCGVFLGADVLQPSFYPLPNDFGGPYGANTYTALVSAPGDGVLADARLDYQAKPFDKPSTFTARYNFTDDRTLVPAVDSAINASIRARTRTNNIALAVSSILSSEASNQLRFSYGRTTLRFDEVAGSPFVFDSPNTGRESGTGPVGRILYSPYSSLGVDPSTFPQSRVNNTFQIADAFVLTRGPATVRFGADVRRVQLNSALDRNYRAQVAFSTGLFYNYRQPPAIGTGLDFAAAGVESDVSQALALVPNSSLGLRFTETNLFAETALKITRRLVLTAGLRYEYNSVPTDSSGRLERELTMTPSDLGAFDATDSFVQLFLETFDAQREVLGGRTKIYDSDRNDFAPRVGLAWDVLGNGRLAVRAGYGLYHDTILGTLVSQSRNVFPSFVPVNFGAGTTLFPDLLVGNPANVFYGEHLHTPLVVPGTTNTLNVPPDQLASVLGEFVFTTGFRLGFTLPDRYLRTPYVHQYALTVEATLFDRYTATLSYVGSSGHKLVRIRTPNGGEFTPIRVAPSAPTFQVVGLLKRPDDLLGPYTIFEDSANSSYNALQASLVRRMASGLAFRMSYTYAHAIDDVSDVFDVAGAPALAQDELARAGGLRAERGNAGFDVRHRFTFGWQYELPFWTGLELSGIATLQTGQPFTVNTSLDVNRDGNRTDRLDTLAGLALVNGGRTRILVTTDSLLSLLAPVVSPTLVDDQLEVPATGSVGRNTFRAAGIATVDVAFGKRFAIGDRQSITARVEAFNLFNRTHFGIPVRVLESPGFGSSTTTTVPARTVQLAVRYAF